MKTFRSPETDEVIIQMPANLFFYFKTLVTSFGSFLIELNRLKEGDHIPVNLLFHNLSKILVGDNLRRELFRIVYNYENIPVRVETSKGKFESKYLSELKDSEVAKWLVDYLSVIARSKK